MRAALLHGARDLRLGTVPDPVPTEDALLLRVREVGICGSDLHFYRQDGGTLVDPASPLVLGHEFSAEIADDRGAALGLPPGRLVAVDPARPCGRCEWCLRGDPNLCPDQAFAGTPGTNGGLAEYHAAPREAIIPVPPEFDAATVALLEPLGVAVHTLDLAHLRPMDSVAVVGAGPIGLMVAQVARASGAGRVFVVEPLRYRLDAARRLEVDGVAEEPGAVLGWTNGRGVDVVLEATNAPSGAEVAAALARVGGRIVLAGIPEDDTVTFKASLARRKGLTVKFQRRMGRVYPRAIELVRTARVRLSPLVTHRFPLDRAADAFALQDAYRDGVIKTMIVVR
ncbi:MAG TPA: alcohol dehydrogenase catalytic domain-containing protein [bacterium]|nr:alcohol dehydrogenase catalytic domain-containing protein [bacterium]